MSTSKQPQLNPLLLDSCLSTHWASLNLKLFLLRILLRCSKFLILLFLNQMELQLSNPYM